MSEYFRKPIVKTLMLKGKDAVSISNIEKKSTSGLTDTYEITLTNGTKKSFNVNNGKGIKSIAKTSTSGLVDTYTITYNDDTTSTFTVKNGEKGDTGSVSNLKIGGVNLLSGTKDFSGDWINKDKWIVSNEKYNGFTVITNTKNYSGLRKKYCGKSGEKYNFSCYAKKLKDEEINGVFFVVDGSGKNIGIDDVIIPLKSDWARYNYAITLKADVDFYVTFASYNYESDVVAVCGFKLEREETPTDWTPSLEDYENKFNNIIARLEALEAK